MTTNHRPTLESKRGRDKPIKDTILHSRSLRGQTLLKLRLDVTGALLDAAKGKRALDELAETNKKQKTLLHDDPAAIAQEAEQIKQDAVANSDPPGSDSSEPEASESEYESDSDTEEMQKELERLRNQKAEARSQALAGNPLIALDGSDITKKKSWRSGTAFSRTKPGQKSFTTDTLSSDTHKKFLSKYIH